MISHNSIIQGNDLVGKICLSPHVKVEAAVHFLVVSLLLVHYLMLLPLCMGFCVWSCFCGVVLSVLSGSALASLRIIFYLVSMFVFICLYSNLSVAALSHAA